MTVWLFVGQTAQQAPQPWWILPLNADESSGQGVGNGLNLALMAETTFLKA
jgi:hypothetical protein